MGLVVTRKEQEGVKVTDKNGDVLGYVVLVKCKSGSQVRIGFFNFDKEIKFLRIDTSEIPKDDYIPDNF